VLALIEEGAAAAAPGARQRRGSAARLPRRREWPRRGPARAANSARRRSAWSREQISPGMPAPGRDGRVSKSDVVNLPGGKEPAAAPAPASAAGRRRPAPRAPRGARAEQRVPMTRLRARIAERMVQAQSTQALLTSFNEVDLTAVQ
jgi:2-oxoglutarate dehydrogenase E2 component (dihydrolipoamide succinyltransferase)